MHLLPRVAAAASLLVGSLALGSPAAVSAAPPGFAGGTAGLVPKPACAGVAKPGARHCFAQVLRPASTPAEQRQAAAQTSDPPLTPADVRSAYALDATRGSGQTVAVVEAYRDPEIAHDLQIYRNQFGLPACAPGPLGSGVCLQEMDEYGGTAYPTEDPNDPNGNDTETMLDVEAVSAVCPNCHLLVVEASSLTSGDLDQALKTAVLHANEVSVSIGGLENDPGQPSLDSALAQRQGVAVTVAAGDCGYGTSDPAASPYVTSVGGTSLTRNSGTARGWTEAVWNGGNPQTASNCSGYPVTAQNCTLGLNCSTGYGLDATGSGCTKEPRPSWQPALAGCSNRVMNDISAAADPAHGGLDVYYTNSSTNPPVSRWVAVGGTSESAPIIAGVFALSGGEGGATGAAPLYAHSNYNDVTSGSNVNSMDDCGNALCHAQSGFDGPTGLGTPNGEFFPAPPPAQGYWLVASDGGIFPFGNAPGYGSTGGIHLNQPIVGMAAQPDGSGYWLVASDGGIFPFGNAPGYGSTGNIRLNQPIVGMAVSAGGGGYWLVARDGGIFPFGNAPGYGSTGNIRLNQPIVGMAATPDGGGYWLVASDGGIFPFGNAGGYGSTGNIRLNQPIVGMAATPDGGGYWLVASDGGIFPFGDAAGYGSTGNLRLNQPIVGMSRTPSGNGYWLVASDGGIFPFGDAGGYGSTGGMRLNQPIVGMASTRA